MNNYNNIKVPVERNGASRKNRLPDTLLPEYVKVDERNLEDLLSFVAEYAKQLNYFNTENEIEGTWESFFTGITAKDSDYPPHYALLLAFLRLYKQAQDNMNSFTKRHLDFYYGDVLQFARKTANPEQVHLLVELTNFVQSYLLKKGTLFQGGKDSAGKNILYALDRSTELNKAQVAEIKTVFLEKIKKEFTSTKEVNGESLEVITELELVNGVCASIENSGGLISTLGSNQSPAAEIGFAITAPVLLMKEGERFVTVTITGNFIGDTRLVKDIPLYKESDKPIPSELRENFSPFFALQFSSEKLWIDGREVKAGMFMNDEDSCPQLTLVIEAKLGKEQPAVLPYTGETIGNALPHEWPLVKLLLCTPKVKSDFANPYQILRDLVVLNMEVMVDVKDVKNLILQNDQSVLDANKPFLPFGMQPGVGSDFYIGSAEVFQKAVESLSLHLDWYNLPSASLGDYYSGYSGQQNVIGIAKAFGSPIADRQNKNFKAEASLLINKDWRSLDVHSLFDDDATAQHTLEMRSGNISTQEDAGTENLQPFSIHSTRGFLRLRLCDPDFGHREYPNRYAEIITINNHKDYSSSSVRPDPLPNTPYTPTLRSLSLDYKARKEIDSVNMGRHVFHLHPFGWSSCDVMEDTPFLLPAYEAEGNLYLGINDLQPPCELSVLFQSADGTANPDSNKPEINWAILSNDDWLPMEGPKILFDSTDSFNSPGVITFSIPETASKKNNSFSSGKHWLRASAQNNSDGVCKLTAIRAQAIVVRRVMNDNLLEEKFEPIAPGTIQKMLEREPEIKSITQPYVSVNGKGAENDEAFYTRISERLRHKQRALTCWDYERLVLEAFPAVYKAKCYRHSSWETGCTPGGILVLIIPDLRNNASANLLRPSAPLGLQEKVKEYLRAHCSPHVQVEVKNPVFETIRAKFMVRFIDGMNKGFYERQLQEELKRFLTPWVGDQEKEIETGGVIYKSSLLQFVEERSYVDYVTFFTMNHIDANGNERVSVEEARAITPVSVLTSAELHEITVLDDDAAMCADGIGHMMIETNFITIK